MAKSAATGKYLLHELAWWLNQFRANQAGPWMKTSASVDEDVTSVRDRYRLQLITLQHDSLRAAGGHSLLTGERPDGPDIARSATPFHRATAEKRVEGGGLPAGAEWRIVTERPTTLVIIKPHLSVLNCFNKLAYMRTTNSDSLWELAD